MQAVTIDSALYADAQAYAQERGMSVSALIERYIRRVLRRKTKTISAEKAATLKQIDEALKEFRLIQEGKRHTRPVEELLNEL